MSMNENQMAELEGQISGKTVLPDQRDGGAKVPRSNVEPFRSSGRDATLEAIKTDVKKTLAELDEQVRRIVEYAKQLKDRAEEIRRSLG